MKILVCGGRKFFDYNFLSEVLYEIHDEKPITLLINGNATGADMLSSMWANANKVTTSIFPANWEKYGKSAGYIRNVQMLDEGKPDLVVAFPGGNGTRMMVKLAKGRGLKVIAYN